jgi:hypothetical protein
MTAPDMSIDIEAVKALTAEVARLADRLQFFAEWDFCLTAAVEAGVAIGKARAVPAQPRQPAPRPRTAPRPDRRGIRLVTGEAATQ